VRGEAFNEPVSVPYCRQKNLRFFFFLLLLSVSVFACGKKGPPTLKAYEKPEPPSGLTAVHREEKVVLSWYYPDNLRPGLKGFHVLRSPGDGFTEIGFTKNDATSFADVTFTLDVPYTYKVVAESLRGISSNDSPLLKATPGPSPHPPQDLRFSVTSEAVELSWKSSGEGICYTLYKTSERSGLPLPPLNREPVCATSFKDMFLMPDRPVYYTITAHLNSDVRDESRPSQELEVNPSHFIPSPPSDIRVTKTDGRVYMMWKESPEAWTRGYRVYRKRNGDAEFGMIGETPIPTFTDTVKTSGNYWYMIRARGPIKESDAITTEVIIP
jgi:fibronectin type 3 domain-containing protein/predicted small lipoprotein YifL